MQTEAMEVLKKALALPDSARAELACTLIDSLDEEVDQDVEASWEREISLRMETIRSGTATLISGREAIERLRAK